MEILLLDLVNVHFDDYRYRNLQLSTKNLYSNKYETIYLTDEIKYIQKIFTILNSNHFYYGEYVSPYYVHYIDLDNLKLIINNLFKIEKKKNKYLKIENFKQRFFGNQLYYNKLFLDNDKYSSLEWRVENCYCIYEYGELKSKNLLIFHDYFQDENMIYDYFEELNNLLINFEPEKITLKEMTIPFYTSFKSFKDNYSGDLKKWLKNCPDADENDFAVEVLRMYNSFLINGEFSLIISSNWIPEDYPEYVELTIGQYKDFMQEKLLQYLYSNYSNYDGDRLEIPDNLDAMDFWEVCNVRTKKNSGVVDDENHNYLKEFFKFEYFFETLVFDDIKYNNFRYSVPKIINWVKSNFIEDNDINLKEEPEDDFLENTKFTVPQIIKILDKLNIKGWMLEKGFTNFQTTQLLAEIFNRSEKTIRNNFESITHDNMAQEYIDNLKNLKAKR